MNCFEDGNGGERIKETRRDFILLLEVVWKRIWRKTLYGGRGVYREKSCIRGDSGWILEKTYSLKVWSGPGMCCLRR